MKKAIVIATCVGMLIAVPALAFNPRKGPPTRAYYAGGAGNHMKARLVVQLPYTMYGRRNPAFDDGVTVRDCHGNHQFVEFASAGHQMGYPKGSFSDKGRGAVIRHYNGQETYLKQHKHLTASGTIDGKAGSITYTVAGCKTRRYALKAKR